KPQVFENPHGEKSKDFNSFLNIAVDVKEGVYYFFGVNGVARGRYIQNDSIYLRSLQSDAIKKLSEVTIDSPSFYHGNRMAEFTGLAPQNGLQVRTRYIIRGNQWYALVGMCSSPSKFPQIDRFFNSLSFLDFPEARWSKVNSPDSQFSSWCPSVLVPGSADDNDQSVDGNFNAFDSARSDNYSVVAMHFAPHFWSESDSAFWADRIAAHLGYADSLIYKKPITNGNARGWETLRTEKNADVYKRQRFLLFGDQLYSLFVCAPRQYISSENINRFFEDFRFFKDAPATTLFNSRARQLIDDAFSNDSAAAAAAGEYLDKAPFRKTDLPLLHQSMLREPSGEVSKGNYGT
ncbi:MAG TPA: hypothetical protein VFV08_13250, partial [Puia sp.]|nr:hypothetical protein [Puia sp.]